jgi:anti-sigma28 factor (negative regulator of flagellin synthesis)
MRVDSQEKQERVSTAKKAADITVSGITNSDKVAISPEAQKAEEVARFTKMAQEGQSMNADKIAALKAAIVKPAYLDSLSENFAEHIAQKLVEAFETQYDLPKDR